MKYGCKQQWPPTGCQWPVSRRLTFCPDTVSNERPVSRRLWSQWSSASKTAFKQSSQRFLLYSFFNWLHFKTFYKRDLELLGQILNNHKNTNKHNPSWRRNPIYECTYNMYTYHEVDCCFAYRLHTFWHAWREESPFYLEVTLRVSRKSWITWLYLVQAYSKPHVHLKVKCGSCAQPWCTQRLSLISVEMKHSLFPDTWVAPIGFVWLIYKSYCRQMPASGPFFNFCWDKIEGIYKRTSITKIALI